MQMQNHISIKSYKYAVTEVVPSSYRMAIADIKKSRVLYSFDHRTGYPWDKSVTNVLCNSGGFLVFIYQRNILASIIKHNLLKSLLIKFETSM